MRSRCRLCRSDRLAVLFEVRGSTLDRCERCGFVQVRDRPSAAELRGMYRDGYFEKGKYDYGFAQRRENQRRLALIEHAGVPPRARVLDVGCATGDFVAFVGDRFDMWGIDVSLFAVEVARKKNPRFSAQLFSGFVEDQGF